jgi:hypothetical protein
MKIIKYRHFVVQIFGASKEKINTDAIWRKWNSFPPIKSKDSRTNRGYVSNNGRTSLF